MRFILYFFILFPFTFFQAPASELAKWSIETGVSPMTDQLSFFATTPSKEPHQCASGIRPVFLQMAFQCKEGKALFGFITDCILEANQWSAHQFEYRLDKNKLKKLVGSISDDRSSLLLNMSKDYPDSLSFIESLKLAKSLTIRLAAYQGTDIIAKFDLTGIGRIIDHTQMVCQE